MHVLFPHLVRYCAVERGRLEKSMTREELEEGAGRQRRREQLVVFVLAAVQFITIVDFMIVMPLGPQLMRTLHISPAQFGLIVSSYTFAAGVAGLVASSVVD